MLEEKDMDVLMAYLGTLSSEVQQLWGLLRDENGWKVGEGERYPNVEGDGKERHSWRFGGV